MGSTNPRQLAKNSIKEQTKSASVREQWFLLQVPSLSSLSDGLRSGSLSPISPFLPWVAFGLNILSQPQNEKPHCPLLPGRCVCQPSFTGRNNSRQISASLHNHQRTQGQNNYTLRSQERNANWDVKKHLSTVKKVGIYFHYPSSYLRHVFSIAFFYIMGTDYDEGCRDKGVM